MKTIDLREWTGHGSIHLESAQIEALATTDAFVLRPDPAFPRHWFVGAKQFVGVTQFGELELRVAPKIGVDRLLELLLTAQDLIRWDDTIRPDLGESPDLIGVIASSFAAHASDALRQGLLNGYRSVEDALPAVRGRILAGAQLARRAGLPLPVELAYDEFTPDVVENQLLAGATRLLLRLHSVPAVVRNQLRRIDLQMFDVAGIRPSSAPPTVSFTRLNGRYRTAVALARLVLQSCSLEEIVGSQAGIGFLVDMNRLFEDVVGNGLSPFLDRSGVRLELQKPLSLDSHGRLSIRPDIVCRSRQGIVLAVADVKYKQPDLSDVSTNDVYQALAYASRFGLETVHLIYASPPPYEHLKIGDVNVTLSSINLDTSASERSTQLANLAKRLIATNPNSHAS